ncbi:hypothetical protein Tco_0017720 [Tanacetum coccineum]
MFMSLLGMEKDFEFRFALKNDRKKFSTKVKYEDSDFDSVPDDRYAVSYGSGYAVLISLNEYAVLDRIVGYAVSNGNGYAVFSYRPE